MPERRRGVQMLKPKKYLAAAMAVLFVLSLLPIFVSCAKNITEKNAPEEKTDVYDAPSDVEEDAYADNLAEQDFGGSPFRIAAQDAPWLYVLYDVPEETGEVINDAVYKRNRKIEERFNVEIVQNLVDVSPGGVVRKNAKAGIAAYELYLPVDRDALTFGADGIIYRLSDIPNVDIARPYYSQLLNRCLTIGGDLYFAYGSFNLSVYDYTHLLLFNKKMVKDLGLVSPYDFVESGNWTYDKYAEMAKAAVKDADGNGIMDANDIYGLVSQDKQVLPCFWIAAGVQSISKSSEDIPQFTLIGDEKFAAVIDRIFSITYDNDSWYRGNGGGNLADGHTLFFDCNTKGVGDLRGLETDFGILPYPKYTAEQERYYSRVEGGNPGVVSIAATNLEMIGTIFEALNAESAKTVIPAYYDVALKAKYARDEESAGMLDLIFDSRIYDLGDTYWCDILRGGMFLNMFKDDNRNLASELEKVEPKINKEIEKVVNALVK